MDTSGLMVEKKAALNSRELKYGSSTDPLEISGVFGPENI
jgi:hypothetical protein